MLGQVSELSRGVDVLRRHVIPGNRDTAGGRRGESGDHPHRRCLSGAVRPEESDDLAFSYIKLEEVVKREIYKLSKGYRQRVGLAQALLGKPEVLLLDEPTAGLDPAQIQETREVIRSFGKEHAVLISTHILPEVTLICQRVAIIYHGRLLAIDSPAGLREASEQTNSVTLEVTAPPEPLRQELMAIDGVMAAHVGQVPGRDSLCRVECQVDAREDVESDIARVVAGRWALHRLDRQQPTLENVFIRYISDAADQEVVA